MNSLHALRRANPRADHGFAEAVEGAGDVVRARIAVGRRAADRPRKRGRLVLIAAVVVTLAALAALAATLSRGPSGVENATAAVKKAATLTAASAERSGTAVVRITHNGELWAGTTIRWNGNDLELSGGVPRRGRAGSTFLLVDGMMYATEDGVWVEMGSPDSIDPGSGTMPDEYLAAARGDAGGATLRRLTGGMTGLATRRLGNGSTVYSGQVAAGLVARRTGFKAGQSLRMLPFGYVAHDAAADPASPLDAAVTVGPDGVVRQITVSWGTWTYAVAYSRLGATPAPATPANARPLKRG